MGDDHHNEFSPLGVRMKTAKRPRNLRRGISAADLLVEIANFDKEIQLVTLATFTGLPRLEERIRIRPGTKEVLRVAENLRSAVNSSYWSSLLIAELSNAATENRLVAEAIYHDKRSTRDHEFKIPTKSLSVKKLDDLMQDLRDDSALAIHSKVRIKGGATRHLPMMDFSCKPTPQSLRIVIKALKLMGQEKGAVVLSGKSFHYFGFQVLTEKGWREFLGRCLLLAPITDSRYIGHRLIDGACSLRISPNHASGVPKVVDIIWF
jgi:hypothetical protein